MIYTTYARNNEFIKKIFLEKFLETLTNKISTFNSYKPFNMKLFGKKEKSIQHVLEFSHISLAGSMLAY